MTRDTIRRPNAFILARNAGPTCEYWTGTGWTTDKTAAKTYKTLQAIDAAAARIPGTEARYITE